MRHRSPCRTAIWWLDTLTLMCVIRTLGETLLRAEFAELPHAAPLFEFYFWAALYGSASWMAHARPARPLLRALALGGLIAGAVFCLRRLGLESPQAQATSTVARFDWLLLGLCSAGSAALRWSPRR